MTLQFACGTLHQLSKVISAISFDILGVCETVLVSPVPSAKAKEYAMGIMFGIAFIDENRKMIVRASTLVALIVQTTIEESSSERLRVSRDSRRN